MCYNTLTTTERKGMTMSLFLEKIREEEAFVQDNSFAGGRMRMRTVARCKCGAEIHLVDPMDNECEACGRLYNMSGQEVNCRARDIDPMDAGECWDDGEGGW